MTETINIAHQARINKAVETRGPIVSQILNDMNYPEYLSAEVVVIEYLERTGQMQAMKTRNVTRRPDGPGMCAIRFDIGQLLKLNGYERTSGRYTKSPRFRRVE